MTRTPVRNDIRILLYDYGVLDGWMVLPAEKGSDALAEKFARNHADTPEARAFLTKSLVSINHDAINQGSGLAYAYVPERQVGEVAVYGHSAVLVPREEVATAEAYAARSPQQVGGRKFKVLDHSAIVTQCPAGPAASVITLQRERYTTSIFLEVDIVIFPEYEGLREGVQVILYSSHLDLVEDMGRWCKMLANSVRNVKVGRADGTVLAVFGDSLEDS